MAYAEKRDGKLTGYWYGEVDLRHKGGARFRERFETKRKAEGWEAYVRSTGELPPWTPDGVSGHTFASVAQDCKARHRPWQRGKDRSGIQRIDTVCAGPLGKLPIGSITRTALDDLVEGLRKRPGRTRGEQKADATIDRYLSAISVVIKFAMANPEKYGKVQRPSFPWQKGDRRREEVLSIDQENAVCRVLETEGKPGTAFLVRLLAASGLRCGELYKLTPDQIGNDTITLRSADTKTKTARVVVIPQELATNLRAMVAWGKLPKPLQLWKEFKRACKTCGYSEELTIHSLRHTRATRLLQAGVDPQTCMQILGWRNFSTMARYRHVDERMQREAAKLVSLLRGELPENTAPAPTLTLVKTEG